MQSTRENSRFRSLMAAQLALRASQSEGGEPAPEEASDAEEPTSEAEIVVEEAEPTEQEVKRAEREEEKLEEALLRPAQGEESRKDEARP